jgi:hypothetical protein
MDASYARFLTRDIDAGNNVPDVLDDHRQMLEIIDTGAVEKIEPLMRRHLYGNIRRLGPRLFTEFRSYFLEETLPGKFLLSCLSPSLRVHRAETVLNRDRSKEPASHRCRLLGWESVLHRTLANEL